MPSPLSADLRARVVAAVAKGASRHQAAKRFGVSVSSAVRWQTDFEREGRTHAKPHGGDRRSQRVEAHADLILTIYEAQPDILLEEVRSRLSERGLEVGQSSLSRFFKRHAITRKKSPRTRLSRIART